MIDREKWEEQPLIRCLWEIKEVRTLAEELERLQGAPDENQQEKLKVLGRRAVEKTVPALESFFGIERDIHDISPFHSELWRALVDYTGVGDGEFVTTVCKEGSPVGIDEKFSSSNGLHPKSKKKARHSDNAEEEFAGNYPSPIPGAEIIMGKLIEGEIERGWMEEVPSFKEGCKKVRLALVPKKSFREELSGDYCALGDDELRKTFRIVEDYRRNSVNSSVSREETNLVPGYRSVARLLRNAMRLTNQTGAKFTIFESDVEQAYRTVPINPKERDHLICEVGGKKVRHCRVPMGLSSSAYIWTRLISTMHRVLRVLLQLVGTAGLCLLDDNFWVILEEICGKIGALLLVIPSACGVPFGWHKLRLGKGNTFGGFAADVRGKEGFVISLPRDKREKIRSQVEEMLNADLIVYDQLEKLIGRLGFCCQIAPSLRGGLARLYSAKKIMDKKGLLTLRCSRDMRECLMRWRKVIEKDFRRVITVTENGDDELPKCLVVADASVTAIAAVALRRDGTGVWTRLILKDLELIEEVSIHERTCSNMVALELCAVLAGCVLSHRIGFGDSETLVLSDSNSGVNMIRKGFTAKLAPARILSGITNLMVGGVLFGEQSGAAFHIPGVENTLADRISRDVAYEPPNLAWHQVTATDLLRVMDKL